ncbi:MAG: NAD(P)-dependent alcohol dehydrogenase [Nitrospira sp.]|uniref:Aldehyde reductase, NADPH-dependent n=1 Tax=Nitrospira defluvii TaxID=330214 RepID=A0ABM8QTE8_9BACT|nr:NAD(P)-dependent alcohol dehydrogenase [Nitrospira defluvii]MCS6329717.1 NAD(P)-dependent alcohol dehydrogenase [Nitrospira sp.]CAE6714439.1 aldehyde reductase, NADPH-dependent [Nitrospira defluvii]
MIDVRGYAARTAKSRLAPFTFSRREVGRQDILIGIRYCGICHSDVHQARDEWGGSIFPMVPGHEIVGVVERVGASVKQFKVGQMVGVGCFVDSCRTCPQCKKGQEQYCEGHLSFTYNGKERDGITPTYGGYSTKLVVDQRYVLRIPKQLRPEEAAPLLCAGITAYSPLRHWGVGKTHRLAVVGLGGLGHMAVKIGKALGAHVTVLSHSGKKRHDAKRLGATDFFKTSDPKTFTTLAKRFDFILDTVSAPHDLDAQLELLKTDGTMILVGVPDKPAQLGAFPLILKRRRLVGSLIGGIQETQEMLDFCAKHKCGADVEVIPIQQLNEAYDRLVRGDVRYRFVIDMSSLT